LEELGRLFTDDAEMDYGFGRVFSGRDNIIGLLRARLGNYKATSHHLSNILVIESSASIIRTQATIYAWHELLDGSQAEVWGRYANLFRNTPDGWRIAEHVVRAAGSRGFATPSGLPSPFQRFERSPL
jgi:ketosteroid isomerase-like protein